jgi:hypothetical protein
MFCLYNIRHPRGRKYTSNELQRHKEQWINICETTPSILVQSLNYTDGGPLSGLISELEFNSMSSIFIVPFEYKEFSKAVSDGLLSVLDNFIKNEIMSTYIVIRSVNESIKRYSQMGY